jgi:hypothetical protein
VQPFLFGKSTCRSVAFASSTGADPVIGLFYFIYIPKHGFWYT